jgi:TatD DNase family protein
MIDSHCHLADEVFESELTSVVARAKAAGLAGALCILAAEDEGEARRAAKVSEAWKAVRFATGVHPHQAKVGENRPGHADALVRARAAATAAVAVGEIGLDYHYDFSPRAVQREVFVEQLATARALNLPVIIHTREADDDTFEVLSSEGGGIPGVFHCFTGGVDRARKALDLGFHLSLAGIVTFPKATDLHEVAAFVPEDRMLVETDSPFLAPVPHRGTRNEPAFVSHVVDALAKIRGASPLEIAARTTRNFLELFVRTVVTPR